MRYNDLFEQADGHLDMIPDEGATVFMHAPESLTDALA